MAHVSEETHSATRIIRYANPPRHYMTGEGSAALAAAINTAASDAAIRAIVLTGTDDVFVRHYDVEEIVQAGEAVAGGAIGPDAFHSGPFVALQDACFTAPKPVIAAINGTCMGGGFEIALACDLRVASPIVQQIGLPETRIGIFPGGGGTQRLPRVIGEAAALNFILRGSVVDAGKAMLIGLVHELAEDPVARAVEIAAEFETKGPEGIAAAKALVRSAMDHPLADGLAEERSTFHDVLKDGAAMDTMRDFLKGDGDITA